MPLATAERALLDERRPLTRAEVDAVAALPLDELPSLVALAHRVRLAYMGTAVELESLINAKSGACPEDCAFCSQSVRFDTEVDVYAFLDLDEVLAAARATRDAGATQFCIVVAVRGPEERLLRKVIDAVHAVRDETGLEVACSLGLLTDEQAERLAAAGVRRYNHNLEASRAVFPSICTTHSYDDRVATSRRAIDAGMELCCGGILGMGETLAQRIDFAFELAELAPCEVPVNLLDPARARRSPARRCCRHAKRSRQSRCSASCSPARGCASPAVANACSESSRRSGCSPARTRSSSATTSPRRAGPPPTISHSSKRSACRWPTGPAKAASSSTPPAQPHCRRARASPSPLPDLVGRENAVGG